jgi:hypothetical protein
VKVNPELNRIMSSESRKLIALIHKKILAKFKQFEKNFTEKSEPIFLNEMGLIIVSTVCILC